VIRRINQINGLRSFRSMVISSSTKLAEFVVSTNGFIRNIPIEYARREPTRKTSDI